MDSPDIVYHVAFTRLFLGSGDHFIVGYGLDPLTGTTVVSYGDMYQTVHLYPADLFVNSFDLFLEFSANAYDQNIGFELNVVLLNVTGKHIQTNLGLYIDSAILFNYR